MKIIKIELIKNLFSKKNDKNIFVPASKKPITNPATGKNKSMVAEILLSNLQLLLTGMMVKNPMASKKPFIASRR